MTSFLSDFNSFFGSFNSFISSKLSGYFNLVPVRMLIILVTIVICVYWLRRLFFDR